MSDGLTKREQAVLSWLENGLSNKEIAIALGIPLPKDIRVGNII